MRIADLEGCLLERGTQLADLPSCNAQLYHRVNELEQELTKTSVGSTNYKTCPTNLAWQCLFRKRRGISQEVGRQVRAESRPDERWVEGSRAFHEGL